MISVCMPYRQRQQALDRTLEAYRKHYPDIEISICDDGSPSPVEAPGCVVTRLPPRWNALNPCVPINEAVKASSGDPIVLTNPEILHKEPVLYSMRESLKEWNDYVIAAVRKESGQWMCRSDYVDPNWTPLPPGAGMHWCVMFTRELWNKAGGFDEDYREGQACDDADWCWRAHSAGANFIFRDDCVVYDIDAPKTQWPPGGTSGNRALIKEKWGHLWN